MNAALQAAPAATPISPVASYSQAPAAAAAPKQAREHGGPPNRSSIAGRLRPDFVFVPRHSSFCLEETVTIQAHPIIIAFERTFQKCQFALYELEATAPIIATSEEAVTEVMSALDKAMGKFSAFLDNESARCRKILEDNGRTADSQNGHFSKPRDYHVNVYSPRSRTYLSLLTQADQLIGVYSRLWFEGFVSEVQMKRAIFNARRQAISLARSIWDLHTRAITALRRSRSQYEDHKRKAIDDAERQRIEAKMRRADELLADNEESTKAHIDENGAEDDLGESELMAEEPAGKATKPRRTRARKTDAATEEAEA